MMTSTASTAPFQFLKATPPIPPVFKTNQLYLSVPPSSSSPAVFLQLHDSPTISNIASAATFIKTLTTKPPQKIPNVLTFLHCAKTIIESHRSDQILILAVLRGLLTALDSVPKFAVKLVSYPPVYQWLAGVGTLEFVKALPAEASGWSEVLVVVNSILSLCSDSDSDSNVDLDFESEDDESCWRAIIRPFVHPTNNNNRHRSEEASARALNLLARLFNNGNEVNLSLITSTTIITSTAKFPLPIVQACMEIILVTASSSSSSSSSSSATKLSLRTLPKSHPASLLHNLIKQIQKGNLEDAHSLAKSLPPKAFGTAGGVGERLEVARDFLSLIYDDKPPISTTLCQQLPPELLSLISATRTKTTDSSTTTNALSLSVPLTIYSSKKCILHLKSTIAINFALSSHLPYPSCNNLLSEQILQSPADPRLHLTLGRLHLENNNGKEATKSLLTAAKLDKSSGEAFRLLGKCYELKGDVARALGCYEKSVRLLLVPSGAKGDLGDAGRSLLRLKSEEGGKTYKDLCTSAVSTQPPLPNVGWAWLHLARLESDDRQMQATCYQQSLRCPDIAADEEVLAAVWAEVSFEEDENTSHYEKTKISPLNSFRLARFNRFASFCFIIKMHLAFARCSSLPPTASWRSSPRAIRPTPSGRPWGGRGGRLRLEWPARSAALG